MPKPAIPHPNWRLSGHEWAVQLLKAHLAQEAVRHAYLFTGPEGVGRRTLAIRLAQALNCTQPPAPGEPCFTCRACTQIERMLHPDLAVVQAEGAGGVLKVEKVRQLQRSLSLAPYEARYRVALLLRFEQANASAANALLKTLEEPPPHLAAGGFVDCGYEHPHGQRPRSQRATATHRPPQILPPPQAVSWLRERQRRSSL